MYIIRKEYMHKEYVSVNVVHIITSGLNCQHFYLISVLVLVQN